MALTMLIDTSVASRLHRAEVSKRLYPATRQRQVGRTRVTDLEVGFSARNGLEWTQLNRALSLFELTEIEDVDLVAALDVQRRLAAQGLRGRKLPDLIIAAAAQRRNLTLLHYDKDFDLIATETGQSCEWVVPRGSID